MKIYTNLVAIAKDDPVLFELLEDENVQSFIFVMIILVLIFFFCDTSSNYLMIGLVGLINFYSLYIAKSFSSPVENYENIDCEKIQPTLPKKGTLESYVSYEC